MSNKNTFDKEEIKDQFTGFHVTQKGKDRLEFMANWFHERGMIKEKSYSEAARQCLSIGWTLVAEVVEAEADGKKIETVTFPVPKIILRAPIQNPGAE